MKKWMQKLMDQFDIEIANDQTQKVEVFSEERATLLFFIDTLNKHLIDIENHPIRKTREILDGFSKQFIQSKTEDINEVLFKVRQFYAKYRIDEFNYFESTFEDFKSIVCDFADQLSEDVEFEAKSNDFINSKLNHLKEAVEANSIIDLKTQSREFIDAYIQYQSKKETRNAKKIAYIENNLNSVKRKLNQANENLVKDHLTKAYNRRFFDQKTKELWHQFKENKKPISLIILDIDFFKKINDNFGHDTGDFILVECVKILSDCFSRDIDWVSRIGGEEFAILLPGYRIEHAADKAHKALERVRKEVFVKDDKKLSFTVSMGVSQLGEGEDIENWIKRTDEALYHSKNNGRNQFSLAKYMGQPIQAA